MTPPPGSTRSVLHEHYALLAPDGLVPGALPGWRDVSARVAGSPAMDAKFAQTLITFRPDGRGAGSTRATELFAFVLAGACSFAIPGTKARLATGGFVFVPPSKHWEFTNAEEGTRLLLWQKTYQPEAVGEEPPLVIGHESERPATPWIEEAGVRVQTLLPDQPEFDLAVNLLTFAPGATLPRVETPGVEECWLMLGGQGVCRLAADWHVVQAGDALRLRPACPRWFGAMGKTPASWLRCLAVNRGPATDFRT